LQGGHVDLALLGRRRLEAPVADLQGAAALEVQPPGDLVAERALV
jgi:hypothetical protein